MSRKQWQFFGLVLLGLAIVLLVAGQETALVAAPGIQSISFGAMSTLGNPGATVRSLAAGDLDNDGDADLVSADGGIDAWENGGTPFSGAWPSRAVGAPGVVVHALVVGDLDNDGDLDVASGSNSAAGAEVVVWQNDGTPFDAAWTSRNVAELGTANVRALAIGDLDNDGDLDLVSGDSAEAVRVWLNPGSPFAYDWEGRTPGIPSTGGAIVSLAVGDLDNDGDLDIISGNDSWVIAWENDGPPVNDTWDALVIAITDDAIESLALADLDGDGDLDIVAGCGAGEDHEVTSWENDGSPFAGVWSQQDVGGPGAEVPAVVTADWDVDGDLDVGSGSLTAAGMEVVAWENDGSPFVTLWSPSDIGELGADVHALAAADLDGDGDPDIVAGTTQILAWPNGRTAPDSAVWTSGNQPLPAEDALSVSLADFDHDGKLDIAAGTLEDGVQVWAGDGGYTWTPVTDTLTPESGNWPDVVWGQIDNDADLDLAAANSGDGLRVWTITEGGGDWDDDSSGLPTTGNYLALDLGDLDHDGRLDLVACGDGVGVSAWQGSGAVGTTVWSHQKTVSDTASFGDIALGHVNHDGNLDVVAASPAGAGIRAWLSDGHFGLSQATAVTDTESYEAVALGDVDNDGDLDVAGAPIKGGVRVWLGDGGTAWTDTGVISPTLAVFSLDLGDWNHDGFLDILAGTESDGLRVWTGDGGSSWINTSTKLETAGHFYGVALGRVDGDASLDVVGAESNNSGVRIWTSAEPPPGGWAGFQPAGWSTSQVVDCSVQVVDVGSGLDVSTAEYRFSSGSGWSTWLAATVTGSDGSTTPETISATSVPFNQDSNTQNSIQFRIQDLGGHTGASPLYNVLVDSTPPWNPTDLDSTSHTVGAWDDDPTVDFEWHDMNTDATSGVYGYSWTFSQNPTEEPDTVPEQVGGTWGHTIEEATADGGWYLHLRTGDFAGNWSAAAHQGPYYIDSLPPSVPTLVSSTPAAGAWTNAGNVLAQVQATDGGAGVAGYSYVWHRNPSAVVDRSIDTTANTLDSGPLATDDEWYLRIRAVDGAGLASATATLGPFGIDTHPPLPQSCRIDVSAPGGGVALVEWSYLDATSGIGSYDVQHRFDYRFPRWLDWITGTQATSATMTVEFADIGPQTFRVRARDLAGNETDYDCDDSMDFTDVQILDMEITQGLQNLANEMPLVTHKETYVRLYAASPAAILPGVNAWLHGEREGSPLPGSPLRPSGGRITIQGSSPDRENLNDSFWFELPPEWRVSGVRIRAEIDPEGHCVDINPANDTREETLSFRYHYPVEVRMLPAHVLPRTYYMSESGSFPEIVELFRRIWPIHQVNIVPGGTIYPQWHFLGAEWDISNDMNWVLAETGWYALWDGAWGAYAGLSSKHWMAMVHPDSFRTGNTAGIAYRFDETMAWSAAVIMEADPSAVVSWNYPDGGMIMAHELAHNRTLGHADCTGTEADGGDLDDDWPYRQVGSIRPGCRIAEDGEDSYYGLVMPLNSTVPTVISPTAAAALMSYQWPQWISEWTYRKLFDQFNALAAAQGQPVPGLAQASEYLAVSGVVSPSLGTGHLDLAYRLEEVSAGFAATVAQPGAAQEGAYSLVLLDGGGQTLYSHAFDASGVWVKGAPGRTFQEVLPYDPRTARILLRQGETTLAERPVSAHAPTVTLLSPNGGESIDESMSLAWSGSDADGDELIYSLLYSPDNGQTWQALLTNRRETSFQLDHLDFVPGSDQALVRVVASDGVNTAMDESDGVFHVARRKPLAFITRPPSRSTFAYGETVKLRGMAMDVEDVAVDSAGLAWRSDLAGKLGTGEELWVSDLITGTHRITLQVTDSDGDRGEDEIVVYVGVEPEVKEVYLPLILRTGP